MNIQFQVAGLLMCILLTILYRSKGRMNLYSERLFHHILRATTILLIADIVSVWMIVNREMLPGLLVNAFCKLYLFLLVWETKMALSYILYDTLSLPTHKKVTKGLGLMSVLEALVLAVLPIHVFSNGTVSYSYGSSCVATYLITGCYMFAILTVALAKRKSIYAKRWFAFMIWITIWIVAAVGQCIHQTVLLVGFASALGMLILYIALENPDANRSKTFDCFNTYAMDKFTNEMFELQKPFHVISVTFRQSGIGSGQIAKKIHRITKTYHATKVFRGVNRDFVLLSTNHEEYLTLCAQIRNEDMPDHTLFSETQILLLEDGLAARKLEKIQPMLRYYSQATESRSADNVVTITPKMVDDYVNQKKMIEEIRSALAEDRIEVFLQPIYSAQTDTFHSAEALTRIRKPDNTLIPPGLFIPVAERTGQIVELGERIFEKTCQFLAEKQPWKYGLEYVEINLSVLQCEQENLAQRLKNIMNRYEIDSERINLEITETASVRSKKMLLNNMQELIAEGCAFSLDDFGKGESNLMYIVEMPVSVVKLDYDMIKAYFRIPKARNVVHSVINMAHEMDLKVIAEGVETKEELDELLRQGVDGIQGYYFSKPVPMPEFLELLKEKNIA
ncbi:MAG: EAL domain-containing protein [bacterium]|nr:EAL domain-containing protein [bacterium]